MSWNPKPKPKKKPSRGRSVTTQKKPKGWGDRPKKSRANRTRNGYLKQGEL